MDSSSPAACPAIMAASRASTLELEAPTAACARVMSVKVRASERRRLQRCNTGVGPAGEQAGGIAQAAYEGGMAAQHMAPSLRVQLEVGG